MKGHGKKPDPCEFVNLTFFGRNMLIFVDLSSNTSSSSGVFLVYNLMMFRD